MADVLVDTGFLVALGRRSDPLHAAARAFFLRETGPLVTISPVIMETCHFLDAEAKVRLLDLARSPRLRTLELPIDAYSEVSAVIRKYADRDIDLADAALIWLANHTGVHRILTVDTTDFGVYRLTGGRRFDLVKWFQR